MRKQALWCRASRLARRRSAIWRFVNYCVPNFWNHLFLIIWAPPSPSLLFKHRGNAGPFCIRQCLNYRAGEEPQCLFRRSSVQKLTVNANISKFEGRLAAKNIFKISNIHTWTMTWTYQFSRTVHRLFLGSRPCRCRTGSQPAWCLAADGWCTVWCPQAKPGETDISKRSGAGNDVTMAIPSSRSILPEAKL